MLLPELSMLGITVQGVIMVLIEQAPTILQK